MQNIIISRIKKNACIKDKVAIRYRNEVLTYYELNRMSDYVAEKIQKEIAYKKKCPIIIYQSRGTEFIIFMIAVMKCNCFYIPLEDTTPIERLKYIYDDVQAQLILSTINELKIDEYKLLQVDFYRFSNQKNYELKSNDFEDNDLVYVIYTSGTSGRPKGVKIKYSNLENLVTSFWRILYHNFSSSINVAVLASISFDASVKQIFCSLYYGHTLVISQDSVKYFGRRIHNFHNKYQIMVSDCTPSHIKLMTRQNANENTNVKYLVVGGENLRWEDLIEFRKSMKDFPTIINVYGPTECCVDVAFNIITDFNNEQKGFVPIGLPLDNTELFICNNKERIHTANSPGELYVKGKQVGAGYINIESESFVSTSGNKDDYDIYRTGDLAMYNDRNEIIILSRMDRQVKLNGFRIELEEISNSISYYLKCNCEVVLLEKFQTKKLVAFITSDFAEELLKKYLSERLPTFMIPKVYYQIENIPLTVNGKLDVKTLESIYVNNSNC